MTSLGSKQLHLPWNQSDHYWLSVLPQDGPAPTTLTQALAALGMIERRGARLRYIIAAGKEWAEKWNGVYAALSQHNYLTHCEVSIVPADDEPEESQVLLHLSSPQQAQGIAESLWLGNALLTNEIYCYLQPVISVNDRVFGYESFARVRMPGGEIIAGAAIVRAARALCIEYAIDRQLQVQAIKTFAASHFDGFLFVNFFPGFIQRPEVYLEGLTETVRAYNVVPKHVVLDFTRSETPRDVQHMKRVSEYCRSKGYALALDDVESVANVRTLLSDIRPDYVKLDMKLVQRVSNPQERDAIREIVEKCHAVGTLVVAEGVESEAILHELKALSVDLFQGYYFSPPVPVEEVQRQAMA